jgi:hypothetical protein
MASPRARPISPNFSSPRRDTAKVMRLSGRRASSGLLFMRSKRYSASCALMTACSMFQVTSRFFTGFRRA